MDRLPIEIIHIIVHEIPDLQDRLHVLQVCRRWRALFLATAFRSIHIAWPQLRCLAAAAICNLAIRSSIHEVSVEASVPRFGHNNAPVKLGSTVQDLIDLISESPVEWEAWRKELSTNRIETWIALLLAILPNLTAISARHNHPEGWITRVVSKAAWKQPFDANTLPALQRLESLDLTWCGLSTVLCHREYLPVFHLPSLRTVRLGPVQEPDSPYNYKVADHPAFLPAPATSPVESLVLDYFCNGKHGMADYITSCANLKRFVYQHTNDLGWVSTEEEQDFAHLDASFRPWCFHAALLTQRHSLEVLHLNHLGDAFLPRQRGGYRDVAHSDSHDSWFGSLAEFSKLWDLRIRARNLLNVHPGEREDVVLLKDILPRSLKYLHLADCNEDDCAVIVANLEDLLAQRAERFPDLSSLLISPAPEQPYSSIIRTNESFRKHFTGLQKTCETVGVQFFLGHGDKMIPDVNNWWPGQIVEIN